MLAQLGTDEGAVPGATPPLGIPGKADAEVEPLKPGPAGGTLDDPGPGDDPRGDRRGPHPD